jgi:predicted RNA-binding protein with PIN domain
MRWLIDGYNLMHASGAAGGSDAGPQAFLRRRRRFLNDLAEGLGTREAREATVVFDAKSPPRDLPLEGSYKGIQVLFALGDESADARIELLIAAHSAPRTLTVVSSDRRIRRAASRRKARTLSSDQFLDLVDRLRAERSSGATGAATSSQAPEERSGTSLPDESAYWLDEFREVDALPELRASRSPEGSLLTDADIERIRREVDREP